MRVTWSGIGLVVIVLFLFSCGKKAVERSGVPPAQVTAADTSRQGHAGRALDSLQREQVLQQLEHLVTELAEKQTRLREKEARLARLEDSLKALQQQLALQQQAVKQQQMWMWSLLALAVLGGIFAFLLIQSSRLKKTTLPPAGKKD